MKWLLLTMSVATNHPTGLTVEQSGPYASREACDAAHRMVVQQLTNLKTHGALRVTAVCVPQGKG